MYVSLFFQRGAIAYKYAKVARKVDNDKKTPHFPAASPYFHSKMSVVRRLLSKMSQATSRS